MGLNKYKIGELVSLVDERNIYGIRDFFGINIKKEFMPTVADVEGVNEKKYKVVRKGRFVFSGMQTGRDECIRIGLYSEENPVIVSPAYTTFEISAVDKVLPDYFFMLFRSVEKDRLGWFYSDSSVRANLDWDVFCSIELFVPNVDIQEKYVAVYRAMLANQASYERGLDDLKLTCDAYIEELRRKYSSKKIGNYIEQVKENNSARWYSKVRGVESSSTFIETRAKMQGVDTVKYTVVRRGDFAYNPSRINLGSIAMYDDSEPCIVSPMYEVFRVNQPKELCPEYLMLWLGRKEFQRYTLFNASGSVRDAFDLTSMKEVEIPIPPMDIQDGIVGVYKSYIQRTNIGKKINNLLVRLCPILIKGSIEEAQKKETLSGLLF